MSSQSDAVTVYSDYVCPFCYLGRRSLERYEDAREAPLEIEWHPFDLRAGKRRADGSLDHDVDDGKDDQYYASARRNVERLQDRYDVEMAQSIATDVDSLPAQVVSFYLQDERPDRWRAFDDAVFAALWQDGRDIGDPDVVVDVATAVGLDADEVRTVLDDDARRERLRAAFDDARQEGVTGVPTFVADGDVARGAVPPEQLRRLVEGE
ncbi:DsbA family protein [Halobacteriaceae archaeon GCM10025711]